jgi:hypothetical protein
MLTKKILFLLAAGAFLTLSGDVKAMDMGMGMGMGIIQADDDMAIISKTTPAARASKGSKFREIPSGEDVTVLSVRDGTLTL